MKLTQNERELLRAFWANDYVDGEEQPCPWTFAVHEATTIPKRSAPGVFSSLAKKGLIRVEAPERDRSDINAATVTALGFTVARDAQLIVNKPINGRDYWRANSSND